MNTTTFSAYPAPAVQNNSPTIGDFVDMIRRRKSTFFITTLVVTLLGIVLAFVIPPDYRSTSTILIEQQEIPQDLVRSTVTSYADQRVQMISQRVMTRPNLLDIIEKFNLYEDERKREPVEVVIEEMRDDIELSMISADVVDPRSGRPTQATIAFTLSYVNESPDLAQRVADKLTSLYLNENLRTRTVMAAEAAVFLSDEATRLNQQISYLEKELASFKERHLGSLPELTQMNLQLMERNEREILEVDREIRSVKERKIYLKSELSQISPKVAIFSETGERILSSIDRLKTLESKLISLSAVYSDDHPEIIRLRKTIGALKEEKVKNTTGSSEEGNSQLTISSDNNNIVVRNEIETRLAKARDNLLSLQKRYTGDHPEIIRIQQEITNLENVLSGNTESLGAALDTEPDNPAYIQLMAQLNAAESELESLYQKKKDLKKKLTQYEDRITESPQVERQFRALNRDYENAWAKYQEVKAKQMEAQLAKELESERKGERFTLIDPAILPEEPESPNREAIIILSFLLAMGFGVGMMVLKENTDSAIYGSRRFSALVQFPPLAVVPYIETRDDYKQQYGKRAVLLLIMLSVFAGSLAAVHYFKTPLDVLWYFALRRIGIDV